MDITAWLTGLGLEEYAEAFERNRVTGDLLPGLGEADLREIGVEALGDRKRLIAAIAALAPSAHESSPEHGDLGLRAGERRQVTVLFADIAGFTALSERLGAEAIHGLLNRYFDVADRIVERFGGTVDKHIGDNVMAVFGAPVAHDNDPERAVRAALAIHDAARGIEVPGEGALHLHIGIASGQVVASGTGSDSHREYTVTGDAVNLAARLEGLARPGQTLISQGVQQRVEGLARTVSLGAQSLRGISQPSPVWRVEEMSATQSERHGAPFVGRGSELGQCRAILDQMRASGQGQALILRGAAGIGKTRLTGEVRRGAAEAGFAVHRCLILDFGSQKGQDAVPSLVRSLVGIPGPTAPGAQAEAVDAAIAAGACGAAERVFLNDFLDLPQPMDLRRVFDAMDERARRIGRRGLVAGLAARAAKVQPQLIVIEDLHWADAQTLDILAAIIETAADHGIALIGTTRPENDPLDGAWRTLSLDHPVSIINLGPLRAAEALAMAEGFARADHARLEECLERAGGNPLFLEQLLQNAAESASDLVPGSIQSLVLARMDRLEPEDRQALQAASILGQQFELEALRHLTGRQDYECTGLLDHQLIRPEGEGFLFSHALVRDGVYDSILTATRTELHVTAAAWFAVSDPALYAEHLGLAGDPRAPGAYLVAAQGDLTRYRYDQALTLLNRGADLAKAPEDRIALALAAGETHHDLGQFDQARDAFTQALEMARSFGDADEDDGRADQARALIGLAGVKRIIDDLDGALADLDGAEGAARIAGLAPEEARALHLRGNILFARSDFEGCVSAHTRALDLARTTGMAELEAAALGGLADASYLVGRFASSLEEFRSCVALARANGFGRIEVANLPMIAITAVLCGRPTESLEAVDQSLAAARRVGNRRAAIITHDAAFLAHIARNAFDEARAHILQAIELSRQLGARRFEVEGLCHLGELLFFEGERGAAHQTIREALKIQRELGMDHFGPTILGAVAMTAGEDDEERALVIVEAEALLAKGSLSHNHLFFRQYATEAALEQGDWDALEHHARAQAAFCPDEPSPLVQFQAARGLALARYGRGERSPGLAAEVARVIAEGEGMEQFQPLEALRGIVGELPPHAAG